MEETIKEIKTDHFKTMEELLKHLKIWEEDGDYDAYYRFFCPRCAYELAHEIEKQQKEIEKLQRNIQLIINEIVNKANTYDYQNKITAGINKPTEIAYVTLVDLLEEINKKLGE